MQSSRHAGPVCERFKFLACQFCHLHLRFFANFTHFCIPYSLIISSCILAYDTDNLEEYYYLDNE
jgi:hypothetical protein